MKNYPDEMKTIPTDTQSNVRILHNNRICSQCKEYKSNVKLTDFAFGLKLFCCDDCKC